MARTVILSDSSKWVTLLRFEWEWGVYIPLNGQNIFLQRCDGDKHHYKVVSVHLKPVFHLIFGE